MSLISSLLMGLAILSMAVPDPVPADLIGQIIWLFRRRYASL